jgi:hypothetical protein
VFLIVKVLGACAGSAVASIRFHELPDCNEACTEIAGEQSLFLDRAHQNAIVAVTTFSYGLSGITAFALAYAYRTIHRLGRAPLLVWLLMANWFLPQALAEPTAA